ELTDEAFDAERELRRKAAFVAREQQQQLLCLAPILGPAARPAHVHRAAEPRVEPTQERACGRGMLHDRKRHLMAAPRAPCQRSMVRAPACNSREKPAMGRRDRSVRASYDIVTIGGGLAGASLAWLMASRGARVLVLERTAAFRDRVRGEVLVPWGVADARRLGLDALLGPVANPLRSWDVALPGPTPLPPH